MKILGFNLLKIKAEKKLHNFQDLKINTDINLEGVSEAKIDLLDEEEGILSINFDVNLNYEPEVAVISLSGAVIVSVSQKQKQDILEMWKKQKLPEDFRLDLFNFLIRKTTTKALALEEELNLPPHIPFPTLKKENAKVDNKKSK